MAFMNSQWSIALTPELHPFIKLVLGASALQHRLASILETDSFIAESMNIAAEHNIPIEADMLKQVTRPMPMGIGRFGPAPITSFGWPPSSWLPTQSVATGGAVQIGIGHALDLLWSPDPARRQNQAGSRSRSAIICLNAGRAWQALSHRFTCGAASNSSGAGSAYRTTSETLISATVKRLPTSQSLLAKLLHCTA